ncbi:MAG: hypothetical protein HYY93_01135 [Planctomycetes bacterium]|nr:hypothetical protein [Planctomycetota bacterium]
MEPPPLSDLIGVWVSVACTLFLLSFLYRDNPLYKVGENLFVGVSMGYYAIRYYYDTIHPKLTMELWNGTDRWMIVPAIMTVLLFMRFIKPLAWTSRYAYAALMGIVSGLAIPRFVTSNLMTPMSATVKPLLTVSGDSTVPMYPAIIILIGVVTVLTYFFYSIEHKGPVKWLATAGIYFLMVSFGTSFGLTVMGRVSLLIGRCDDLIMYAGGRYFYATPILLAGTALVLLLWDRHDSRKQAAKA